MDTAKTARLLAGISTAQLAERLKIARTSAIRLEQEEKLTASQVERMASATGIPASFYRGQGFNGLVVARPGRFVGADAGRKAYGFLAANLPAVLDGARIRQFKSSHRCVEIADTPEYCLVILPAENVMLLPENQRGSQVVSDKLLLDAFESDAGIPALLELAGLYAFMPSVSRCTTAVLEIRTADERGAVDMIMQTVESMRRAGHDVEVQVKSGLQGVGYESGYENRNFTIKGLTKIT